MTYGLLPPAQMPLKYCETTKSCVYEINSIAHFVVLCVFWYGHLTLGPTLRFAVFHLNFGAFCAFKFRFMVFRIFQSRKAGLISIREANHFYPQDHLLILRF